MVPRSTPSLRRFPQNGLLVDTSAALEQLGVTKGMFSLQWAPHGASGGGGFVIQQVAMGTMTEWAWLGDYPLGFDIRTTKVTNVFTLLMSSISTQYVRWSIGLDLSIANVNSLLECYSPNFLLWTGCPKFENMCNLLAILVGSGRNYCVAILSIYYDRELKSRIWIQAVRQRQILLCGCGLMHWRLQSRCQIISSTLVSSTRLQL
ncbi:hypothetical protein RRG08_002106 [Elysia crispata]|uniref:Uncharacterized protein n=1 Tax=Elysia crispata TaxID=231223 RepID=A0AAE1DIW3_9GAST|nr:hypothetical protein RRG08_002106 [Elysia crispata]